MQTPLQIRYAGVILGTSDSLRQDEGDLFVAFPEPLPVGTRLELVAADGVFPARVVAVVEASAQAVPGMRVRTADGVAVVAPPAAPAAEAAPEGEVIDASGPTDAGEPAEANAPETSNGDGSKKKSRRRRR